MNDIEMVLVKHEESLVVIARAMQALADWIPTVELRLAVMENKIDTLEALVEVLMIGK